MTLEKLYSVDEVAEAWGVSAQTIYKLISKGELSSVWILGQLRVRSCNLNVFLEKGGIKTKNGGGGRKKAV